MDPEPVGDRAWFRGLPRVVQMCTGECNEGRESTDIFPHPQTQAPSISSGTFLSLNYCGVADSGAPFKLEDRSCTGSPLGHSSFLKSMLEVEIL